MRMSVVKIGWSGGKDSTCATLIELQETLKPLLIGRKNEFPLRKYKYFIEEWFYEFV